MYALPPDRLWPHTADISLGALWKVSSKLGQSSNNLNNLKGCICWDCVTVAQQRLSHFVSYFKCRRQMWPMKCPQPNSSAVVAFVGCKPWIRTQLSWQCCVQNLFLLPPVAKTLCKLKKRFVSFNVHLVSFVKLSIAMVHAGHKVKLKLSFSWHWLQSVDQSADNQLIAWDPFN